jgi:exodeoxyribonuclease VII large subunit
MVWRVAELTSAIKEVLQEGFGRVLVRGEVSGYRGPNARGHLYFSLKDEEASLDAKIWASVAGRLKFRLRDGMEVVAEGAIDLYAPQGRYSLIIQKLEPAGEGALALAFQQLKERLTAEGLMGEQRTRPPRPLPFLPRRIGVVTSRTGAALQDFLRVLHTRHPRLSVLLCHARVQGEGSADEVVRALQRLARTDVDVIVVTRGGGSVEDLWTFNEESVARAIARCPVPVVSAIGHEVDFTIADFVADFRAPTPSAAAERLAPVLKDLELGLATHEGRLTRAVRGRILQHHQRLTRVRQRLADPRRLLGSAQLRLAEDTEALSSRVRERLRNEQRSLKALAERLHRRHPRAMMALHREELAGLKARLARAMDQALAARQATALATRRRLERKSPLSLIRAARGHFHGLAGRLDAMNPLQVMTRGYAAVFRSGDGRLVRSAGDTRVGDALILRFAPSLARTLQDCDEVHATVTSLSQRRPTEG